MKVQKMNLMCANKLLVVLLLTVVVASASSSPPNQHHPDKTISKSKRGAYFHHGNGLIPSAVHEPYSAAFYGHNYHGSPFNRQLLARPIQFAAPGGFGFPFQQFGAPVVAPVAVAAPPPQQYAIRPGGALVQSYNVNYPQLPYHQHHQHYPSYAVAAPAPAPVAFAPAPHPVAFAPAPHPVAFAPAPRPIAFAPAPASILPANHHVHFHPFAAPVQPAHTHFGFPVSTTPLAAPIPTVPIAAAAGTNFFVPNRPTTFGVQFPDVPAPTQRPVFVSFAGTPAATFPSVIPLNPGTALASGQIPSIIPAATTTPATPWRPIFVNTNNVPTTAQTPSLIGSSANRPPNSLLPPYGPALSSDERPNSSLEDFQLSQFYQAQSQQDLFNQQQQQRETNDEDYFGLQQASKGYHY